MALLALCQWQLRYGGVLRVSTVTTSWLVVTAVIIIFPSSRWRHQLDRTYPQEQSRNRGFLYETEPKSLGSNHYHTTADFTNRLGQSERHHLGSDGRHCIILPAYSHFIKSHVYVCASVGKQHDNGRKLWGQPTAFWVDRQIAVFNSPFDLSGA
jgi:hypothetical protein